MKAANLLLRFLLELSALATVGSGGARLGGTLATKLMFSVSAVGVAACVWMLWVAPDASTDVHPVIRWAVEIAVLAAATAALAVGGRPRWAVALAVVYAANRALMAAWDQ